MAGAGKRTFIAGEVLTAAQVNDFLMDQAVMRFSGSAARAASITVPTEGMVTYLDDQNRLEYYNGSAWQSIYTFSALGSGIDGQALVYDSTVPASVAWKSIGGAAAVYFSVAATGVTAIPQTLPPGFYQIQTSASTTWTDEQWRFVASNGALYGANLTNGQGFFSLPVDSSSINITTGAVPFTVLIQEIAGISDQMLDAPNVTSFSWTNLDGGSFSATTASAAASIGAFNVQTGKFSVLGPASVRTNASVISSALTSGSLNASYTVAIVQSNPAGVWSSASPLASPAYPFTVFTGNGTYVAPPWSTAADVLVVAGGGAGGGVQSPAANGGAGGGGGAGGASLFTNVATPGSISVTIGAGGAGSSESTGGTGVSSSFGARTVVGGGGGGRGGPNRLAGNPGGSGGGGGGGGPADSGGGPGTPGQGNAGGSGAMGGPTGRQRGGGGGGRGAVGVDGFTSGNGGIGLLVFGRYFGGGGGGGAQGNEAQPAGAGGLGGGANGAPSGALPAESLAATANTGGGGGGGGSPGNSNTYQTGGAGGSGIVIVKAL